MKTVISLLWVIFQWSYHGFVVIADAVDTTNKILTSFQSYLWVTDWSLLDHPMLPYVYRNIFLILLRTLNVVICEHFSVFIIMSLPLGIGLHSLFYCVSFPIQTIPYLKFLLTFRSIVIVRMEHKIMTVPPGLWDFFGDSLASLWKNEGETLII